MRAGESWSTHTSHIRIKLTQFKCIKIIYKINNFELYRLSPGSMPNLTCHSLRKRLRWAAGRLRSWNGDWISFFWLFSSWGTFWRWSWLVRTVKGRQLTIRRWSSPWTGVPVDSLSLPLLTCTCSMPLPSFYHSPGSPHSSSERSRSAPCQGANWLRPSVGPAPLESLEPTTSKNTTNILIGIFPCGYRKLRRFADI